MYVLKNFKKRGKVLVWEDRGRTEGEKGIWVEVGHEDHSDVELHVEVNRANGLQVEKDEKGWYRALVLRE